MSPQRLRAHVQRLAGDIGERNVWRPAALEQAAAYVASVLGEGGDTVAAQEFQARGVAVRNLELERPGSDRAAEVVVVGAHYDTVQGCPGADDNGSGVAALLEIARGLRGRAHRRTVRLVAFVNEEPPFFQGEEMGSLRYARRCRQRGEAVAAMLSLETIGYYTDAPHTQSYPPPLGLLHPHTGNFIGLVSDLHSRALLHTVEQAFRRHSTVPAEAAAAPAWLPGVGWSDQWSFWQAGYPAVMVTDTAHLRNPAYHTGADTPDTLDYVRMAGVVEGLAGVVLELADGA
ncbi:MAG TPA: M28 family peptidase [Vicinamibacteria bacterium]|nr:M28 family peptidase [Vicinamibacteria bacterium]